MPTVYSGSYQKFYNQGRLPASASYITSGSVKLAAPVVLNLAKGNFSRPSSGSYYLGSTSSIGWVYDNQRRFEDRGDGLRFFTEGLRVNQVRTNRDIGGAGWSAGSLLSQSFNGPSPDGTTLADRMTVSSGGFGRYQSNAIIGSPRLGSNIVASAFARRPDGAGTGSIRISIQDGGTGVGAYPVFTGSENWNRYDTQRTVAFPTSLYYVPAEGRVPNMSIDYWTDLHQVEVDATFPSSPIVTSTISASREADILTFNAGDVPEKFRTEPVSFDVLPSFSNTDITASISGSTQTRFTILSFGDHDFVALSGSQLYVTASTGFSSGPLTSSAISWNRNQKLSLRIDPKFGNILVETSTTSSVVNYHTSGWSWPNTGLYVGSMSGSGNFPFFGAISNFQMASTNGGLDLFKGGTFIRASSASYYVGSTSSIAWADPNQKRLDTRDGTPKLLIEGSRQNVMAFSEDMSVANWTKTTTGLSGSIVAPDGNNTTWITGSASNAYVRQTVAASTWANDVSGSVSCFIRFPDGATGTNRETGFYHIDKTGSFQTYPITGSSIWKRYDVIKSGNSGALGQLWGIGKQSPIVSADTYSMWGYQVEVGAAFPSSYIKTAAATTRAVDNYSYEVGEYPASFFTRGFRVKVYPAFSSEEWDTQSSGTAAYILGLSTASPGLRLRRNSGALSFGLLTGAGTAIAGSGATWSRDQELVLTARNTGGTMWTLELSGATTGNGTGTAVDLGVFPVGKLQIGAATNTGNPWFGRIDRFIEPI